MASSWNDDPLAPRAADSTVQTFMAIMRATSPRFQVRCVYGLRLSLLERDGHHSPAEAATRQECVRQLRLLLRETA